MSTIITIHPHHLFYQLIKRVLRYLDEKFELHVLKLIYCSRGHIFSIFKRLECFLIFKIYSCTVKIVQFPVILPA